MNYDKNYVEFLENHIKDLQKMVMEYSEMVDRLLAGEKDSVEMMKIMNKLK